MEKAIQVINRMQSEGVFSAYAVGGGIAALFYMEPVVTFDLDIFIIPSGAQPSVITLSPIYSWLEKRGYKPDREYVVIEGVPVQFIPVYNDLVKDAVSEAADRMFGTTPVKASGPEYLAAIMLQTFRPKDRERLVKFMDQANMSVARLDAIVEKHGLRGALERFKEKYRE